MGMPTVASVGAIAAGPGSVTPNPGATHTADDIDIVLYECADADTPSLTTANGFARITALNQTVGAGGAGTQMSVWWRRWNGTDGSPVFADAGNHNVSRMISISGCKTSGDPWNVLGTGTTDSSADTSVSAAGATTTAPDCLVLAMACQPGPDAITTTEFGAPSNADLANVTERMDNSSTAGGGGAIWMASGEKAAAGAFGATTCTAVTSEIRVCAVLALEGASSGVTGTIGVTQGADVAAFAGTVGYPATVAATQDAQTGAFAGTVANPVSGTIDATQADQTGAFTGAESFLGTIAANQDDQTAAFVGSLGIIGTIGATQEPDTGALAGTVANPITGSIAATQDDQTAAFTGTTVSDGTLAATQDDQLGAFTGTVANPVTGVLGSVQEDQTGALSGTVTAPAVTGTLGATQDDQTGAFTGISAFGVVGVLGAIQDDQIGALAGTVTPPAVTGTIAAVQDPNLGSFTGIAGVGVVGTIAALQGPNVAVFIGTSTSPAVGPPGSVVCVLGGPTATAEIGGPTVACVLTAPSVACIITSVSVAGTDTVVTSTFRNAAGALADPAAVTAVVQHPDGTQSSPSPTSASTGIWTTVIPSDPDGAGIWFGQISGSGNGVNAVCTFSFCLDPSLVLV